MGDEAETSASEGKEASSGGAVEKTAKKAAAAGGNFISRFFSSILGGLGGLGKGAFGNTIGNPLGVLMNSGLVALAAKIATPDAVAWVLSKMGKTGEDIAADLVQGGTGALVKYSLITGTAINAVTGGVGGAVGGIASGGAGQEEGFLGKAASVIGGALLITGVTLVATGKIDKNGIHFSGDGSTSPAPTPPKPPGANQKIPTP